MSGERPGEMRIGQVLEQARARAGLEIADIEEQTKIRAKYLRALESESWEELPSSAYAKGFLRTYGQLLGLDAEALVDEYRRQVESELNEPSYPLGDQVLERRRRPGGVGGGGRSRTAIVIALVVLVAAGVGAAILITNDDEPKKGGGKHGKAGHKSGKHKHRNGGNDEQAGPVALELHLHEPVEVCLLGGAGEALIDGQVLPAGDRESFEREEFQLRFPSGYGGDQLTVKIAGNKRLLPKADGPAAYKITAPQRVRTLKPPGQSCP
jgi:cytoskeleton protein RodZ